MVGIVRDRLPEMKAILENEAGAPKQDTSVDFEAGQKDTFVETFYEQVQKILTLLDTLNSDVEEVKKRHVEILYSIRTNPKANQNLQDTMTDITKTSLQIRAKLKNIKLEMDLLDNKNKYTAQARIRQTQYSLLTRKFLELMEDYNDEELDYRERCKNRIRRQLETFSRAVTDEELEDMIDKGDTNLYTQDILQESERARQSLADVEARYSDIVNLEKSVQQLNVMFKDMALLIERQGAMVDSIERHVEQAADYVESGYEEVVKAGKYQNKVRRKRCILILCLVVIIIILVVAVPIAVGSPDPD